MRLSEQLFSMTNLSGYFWKRYNFLLINQSSIRHWQKICCKITLWYYDSFLSHKLSRDYHNQHYQNTFTTFKATVIVDLLVLFNFWRLNTQKIHKNVNYPLWFLYCYSIFYQNNSNESITKFFPHRI